VTVLTYDTRCSLKKLHYGIISSHRVATKSSDNDAAR